MNYFFTTPLRILENVLKKNKLPNDLQRVIKFEIFKIWKLSMLIIVCRTRLLHVWDTTIYMFVCLTHVFCYSAPGCILYTVFNFLWVWSKRGPVFFAVRCAPKRTAMILFVVRYRLRHTVKGSKFLIFCIPNNKKFKFLWMQCSNLDEAFHFS
jgi:hypothetical protein